jgi:putative hydrolase of the HAD superfamily
VTPEAVVFDFDGLVMDSEWVIYETAAAAFAHHGHRLQVAAWATIVGLNDEGDDTWWERLCAAAGVDGFERVAFDAIYEGDAAKDELRATMLTLPALPGVEVLVDSLTAAGVPIGVASSSSTGWLERNLERLGLIDRFATLVGSDAVGGIGKPEPDVYLKACDDLGAEPRRSAALEDSAHGVTAAKAAGMAAVAVPSRITRHNDFARADLVVDSLEHLTVDRLASLVERVDR